MWWRDARFLLPGFLLFPNCYVIWSLFLLTCGWTQIIFIIVFERHVMRTHALPKGKYCITSIEGSIDGSRYHNATSTPITNDHCSSRLIVAAECLLFKAPSFQGSVILFCASHVAPNSIHTYTQHCFLIVSTDTVPEIVSGGIRRNNFQSLKVFLHSNIIVDCVISWKEDE